MADYTAMDAAVCGSCAHFRRHYIKLSETHYTPLTYGHCIYPRLKKRSAESACPQWAPKPQEETSPA